MTYKEFLEWTIFYKINPWGFEIKDMHNSIVASTVANVGLMVADPKRLKNKPFIPKMFNLIKDNSNDKSEVNCSGSLEDRIENRLLSIMNRKKNERR